MNMTITKICMACGNSARGDNYDPMHLVNDENICPACGNEWTTLSDNPELQNFILSNYNKKSKKSLMECVEEYNGHPIPLELTQKRLEYCAKLKDYVLSGQSRKDYDEAHPRTYSAPTHKPVVFVECPYCHSANCTKISGVHRWLSTGLLGIASSDIGKQWKCNGCGSKF